MYLFVLVEPLAGIDVSFGGIAKAALEAKKQEQEMRITASNRIDLRDHKTTERGDHNLGCLASRNVARFRGSTLNK
jgi:hypothetical protein